MNQNIKKRIIALLPAVILLLALVSCGKSWTCDDCGKSWSGTAYRGWNEDTTYCRECAIEYWNPFPIEGYKKR